MSAVSARRQRLYGQICWRGATRTRGIRRAGVGAAAQYAAEEGGGDE